MLAPLLVWVIILLFLFPLYVVAFLILGPWRLIVNFIVWKWKPEFKGQFTSRDLAFTCDDFEGRVRKSIINVSTVKGTVDLDRMRQTVKERLLDNPFCYKLHCRPANFKGYWFWKETGVELDSHVTERNEVMTDDDLRLFLPKWGATKFDDQRPLWAIILIPMDKGRTAVITRFHHMIGDGVSCMRLLEYLCDGGWVHLQSPPVVSMSWPHWAYAWFTFPWNALKAYRLARIRKGFRPNNYCGEGYTAWTEISMEKIKVIRRSSKCLFMSVLAGIMSNAFYRLLEANGKKIPSHLRMVIPIPYPYRTEKTMTNHCGWLHTEMELGGGHKALAQFDTNLKNSYRLGMHGVMWEFFRSMYLMPEPLLKSYTTWGEVNIPPVLLSSVPGTLGEVRFCGYEVLQSFPVLGLGCSMGVNATVTTYKDSANLSMRVSKEVIGSQELMDQLLQKYVHEEVDLLYHQALSGQFEKGGDNNCNNQHVQIKVLTEKS